MTQKERIEAARNAMFKNLVAARDLEKQSIFGARPADEIVWNKGYRMACEDMMVYFDRFLFNK